jgi:ERCC4-type nuclease
MSILCPFIVLVDDREVTGGMPYTFSGILADADRGGVSVIVQTHVERMVTGDYSIAGLQDRVVVERKSLIDLYNTLSERRDNFEAEHRRMSSMDFAAVVIEADWSQIIGSPPRQSGLNPKTVFRTALAWQVRYGVHWIPCGSRAIGDRRFAEIMTFRLLEKFWQHYQHEKKERQNGT